MANKIKDESNSILRSDWVANIIESSIKESIVKTIQETIENNVKECLKQKKFTKQMRLLCEKVITGQFEDNKDGNKTTKDESEETVNEK